MIRYALACEQAHEFESWFPSSGAYDAQAARGLLTCPYCGSTKIDKQIMAPRLARAEKEPVAAAGPDQPMALLSERERAIRTMLKAVREHVMKHAEHVGDRFPEEARRIHYGEVEYRSIYGEASPAEARELLEEGIEVHPLPVIADDRN